MTAKRMWLHDEGETINVIPYTTLDSIKMRSNTNDNDVDNYDDFELDYNRLKNRLTEHEASNVTAITQLQNQIDSIPLMIANSPTATTTANGLMSKEDKDKLNNIADNANNYILPTASSDDVGGVKIGNTLEISNDGTVNVKGGTSSLNSLSDVEIDDLSDKQILIYDANEDKWSNDYLSLSNASLNGLQDVNIDNNTIAQSQVLTYDYNQQKWVNDSVSLTINAVYISNDQIFNLFAHEDNDYTLDENGDLLF